MHVSDRKCLNLHLCKEESIYVVFVVVVVVVDYTLIKDMQTSAR